MPTIVLLRLLIMSVRLGQELRRPVRWRPDRCKATRDHPASGFSLGQAGW